MYSLAILVDWENIRKNVFHTATKKGFFVDYNNYENLNIFFNSFINKTQEELFRIYMYVGIPPRKYLNPQKEKIDFTKSNMYQQSIRFLGMLRKMDFLVIRRGMVVQRGYYKKSGNPRLIQKQTDLLLGLDIAGLTFNKIVDRILILSEDTDMAPGLKFAQNGGLQTILGYCDISGRGPHRYLIENSDIVRIVDFEKVFKNIIEKTPKKK